MSTSAASVDERLLIEAAADAYESMELSDQEPALPLSITVPKHTTLLCESGVSERLHERLASSSRSTSSTSSNDGEDEVMAPDLLLRNQQAEDALERRFSSVSLADRAASGAMEAQPPVAADDVSRAMMFNRYARAVPSAQESQPFTAASTCRLSKGLTLPDSSLTVLVDAPGCCSVSCQQQSQWKDERIHELQRALDLMVDAMAIQQRDMAAQRTFLARQSEQLTKLSVTLHQEKLVLQIEKERVHKAMRAATCSPSSSFSSGTCRPPTPSGSSSRSSTPRGTSKPKTSMKTVFSTMTGSSSTRAESTGRRCTVSSIDEHSAAFVSPLTAEQYPVMVSSARSASTSQLAPALVASSRDAVCTSSFSDARTSSASNLSAAEFERSVPLSVLELRATQPSPSWPLASKAQLMSDVSLQDSPVRFGRRSVTNCATSKGRSNDTVVVLSAVAAATESSITSELKKPSLGDRFRSLRWKT